MGAFSPFKPNSTEGRMAMIVFSGTFNHTIDSKNRLFIPAKFREDLGEKFFVMQNVDGCLDIITLEARDTIAQQLSLLPRTQSAEIKRFLFSDASDCSPDSQGRVVLPQKLIELANLQKNVLIVGADDHIEIWNEEKYAVKRAGASNEQILAIMNEIKW